MTDREILDEVYSRLLTNRMTDWEENDPTEEFRSLASLIEMEWQSADEGNKSGYEGF